MKKVEFRRIPKSATTVKCPICFHKIADSPSADPLEITPCFHLLFISTEGYFKYMNIEYSFKANLDEGEHPDHFNIQEFFEHTNFEKTIVLEVVKTNPKNLAIHYVFRP